MNLHDGLAGFHLAEEFVLLDCGTRGEALGEDTDAFVVDGIARDGNLNCFHYEVTKARQAAITEAESGRQAASAGLQQGKGLGVALKRRT